MDRSINELERLTVSLSVAEPWYVLLVLDQEQAQKEAGAIAIDALLLKMQQAGVRLSIMSFTVEERQISAVVAL